MKKETIFILQKKWKALWIMLLVLSAFPAHALVTTGTMTVARSMHTASTLPDGKVLLAGGSSVVSSTRLNSTEIYNPATGLFTAAAPMAEARAEHVAITLSDGRILVMGGQVPTGTSLTMSRTAEIYDPATGLWSPTGQMIYPRARFQGILLQDGRVLVLGGYRNFPDGVSTEIYDPVTGTFSLTGYTRDYYAGAYSNGYSLTLLQDGRVLKIGGFAGATSTPYLNTAEIWSPLTGEWTYTGSMANPRNDFGAVLLNNGKVLVVGGRSIGYLVGVELYDPVAGTFTSVASLPIQLSYYSAIKMLDGNVLMVGNGRAIYRYDVVNNAWNSAGFLRESLSFETTTLLSNGNLLIAGGRSSNSANNYAGIYDPVCSSSPTSLSVTSQSVLATGGNISVNVSVPTGCRWEVSGLPAWVTMTAPATTVGSATITFNVAANPSAARSATVQIANIDYQVNQAPVTCDTSITPALSPTSQNFPGSGGTGQVNVTTGASCSWTVSGVPSWMTITSGASGVGSGVVNYTVAANTAAARSSTLAVANLPFILNQGGLAGSGCVTRSLVAGTVTSGSLLQTACTNGARGTSYYTDRYSFNGVAGQQISIQLTSSAFDTFVYLKGINGAVLSSNDDSGGSSNSRIPVTSGTYTLTASGVYTIEVTSYATLVTGAYSLLLTTAATNNSSVSNSSSSLASSSRSSGSSSSNSSNAANNCAGTAISSGVSVSNALASGDCTTGTRGTSYYTDRYTFNGVPGQSVSIQLTSAAFDTYVYLKNPAGTVITSNDDGGGGTNSRIPATSGIYTLPAGASGVYVIEVTSYSPFGAGTYSVLFTSQ
jgi:hypothetical protein